MQPENDDKPCRLQTVGDGQARMALLDQFSDELTRLGWSSSEVFGIQMAVEESVSNAYRHGNLEGQRGDVEITYRITDREFEFEVSDQGEGFDESQVPDPTDSENLEGLTGRGLLLMRNFMNEVNIRDGGSTISMRKIRSTSEAS